MIYQIVYKKVVTLKGVTPGQQAGSVLTPLEIFLQFLLLLYFVAKEISPEGWLISILTYKRQFIPSLCTHLSICF